MMVNKVVIQSASDDGSTDDVINWLKSLNLNIEIERFLIVLMLKLLILI